MVRGGLAVDRRYIARNRTVHTGYFFRRCGSVRGLRVVVVVAVFGFGDFLR